MTDVEMVGHTNEYVGTVDALLLEFGGSDMPGFIIMLHDYGLISVSRPRSFASKLPYWRIKGDSVEAWDTSLLDKIIEYPGVVYAAITQEETLDLERLDHIDEHSFPWQHWRLIAARLSSRGKT